MNGLGKNKGFSLVEVMVALGLAGGLALIIVKLTEMGSSAQKLVETKDDIHQMNQEIAGVLADRFSCRNTFSHVADKITTLNEIAHSLEITEIKDKNNSIVFKIPYKRDRAEITHLELKNYNDKNQTMELIVTYNYKKEKQILTQRKLIRLMLDIKDKIFQGCVSSTGLLSTDPKEACDYLLGLDDKGISYFSSGECQFSRAVCEKQQRSWDGKGCTFSDEEKATIRKESCMSLVGNLPNAEEFFDGTNCDLQRANCVGIGWEWDASSKKCNAPEAMKKEMNEMMDSLKKLLQPPVSD